MTKRDMVFMNIAKSMSKLSDSKRQHIGCVAVDGKRILSSACNSEKTHPLQQKYNYFRGVYNYPHRVHAEVKCLSVLIGRKDIDFSRISLYIYREHKNGDLALSKPCLACARLIKDLGIRNVHYTGDNSYIHERRKI